MTIRWPIAELVVRRQRLRQLVDRSAERAIVAVLLDGRRERRIPDLDAHGAFERRGVSALRRERRVERLEAPAQTLVGRAVPGRVPRVRVASRQPQHPRAERRHQDGDVARRRGFEHRVARREVPAVERHRLAAQQRDDDPERLLEPVDAVVLREPERVVLRVVPPGPEAEDQPTAAHLVGGRGHLGDERRAPEARAQDERADLDAFGRGCERAHDRPRLELPVDRSARRLVEEVVVHPDRVQAVRLGGPRERRDRRPRRPPAVRVARRRRHDHADLHARSV